MRTLSTVNLTDNQKRVLAKIVASPTPKVAAQQISRTQQFISARDLLVKLGLIQFDPSGASLTDQGQESMKQEALTDESGQLTPDGEELAHTDVFGKPENGKGQEPQDTSGVTGEPLPGGAGAPPGGMDMGMGGTPPGGMMGAPSGTGGGLGLESYKQFAILKDLMEAMTCGMAKSRTARTGTMKTAYTKGRYLRRKGHQR